MIGKKGLNVEGETTRNMVVRWRWKSFSPSTLPQELIVQISKTTFALVFFVFLHALSITNRAKWKVYVINRYFTSEKCHETLHNLVNL